MKNKFFILLLVCGFIHPMDCIIEYPKESSVEKKFKNNSLSPQERKALIQRALEIIKQK